MGGKIIISHRGYTYGPNENQENNPYFISKLLNSNPNLHCEIDLRLISGQFYLGHDKILNSIDFNFLDKYKDRLWIHCKDYQSQLALIEHKDSNKFNFFSHDLDGWAVTSKNYFWFYPGREICGEKSIMLDFSPEVRILNGFGGICTDYPGKYINLSC